MAISKNQKKAIIEKYVNDISNFDCIVALRPYKLSVNELVNIRKDLYDLNAKVNVIKNSLFKIALKNLNIDQFDIKNGPYLIMFCKENINECIKILQKHMKTLNVKDLNKIEIVDGYLFGKYANKDYIIELANMPEKQVSLISIVNILTSPLGNVLNLIESPIRSVYYVANKITNQ
ncbi:MAG: 50S ribosomal protein L10 [Candidatus Dojkabacteria bacterium]|nr:50S ribosomal protein L10 [Candidatus Dojkabacteria bacterium]